MLFRPLSEIRVFGVRLPFTPGILPRQRARLAQSIGAMVERELLTPELLRQRLGREEIREKIHAFISRFTGRILASPAGRLLEGHEDFFLEKALAEIERLFPLAAGAFLKFLRRSDIHYELESRGHVFLNNAILKLNVFQRIFLSAAQYDLTLSQRMPEIVDDLIDTIGNLLDDAAIQNKLLSAVGNALSRLFKSENQSADSILNINGETKEKLDEFLCARLLAAADGQIENALAVINIRSLVSERIDSLEMIRVERIVIDVMADQFKWIDIFGAILGFLIGLFQVFFTMLFR
jgi:uncharacterized membrane protein YheB (UPF0754 family)